MRDVSYFHLRLRHRKPPTIGPFENTQGGLQRTTHWMWERRVGQHPVLDPGHSQESVDRISRWLFQFLALRINSFFLLLFLWRCGGLVVSVLVSRSCGLGSSPGRGRCVVFLGKTLCSHSASLRHPGVKMGTYEINAVGTSIPSRGGVEIPQVASCFLGKTLCSHSASPHPGVKMVTDEINAVGTSIPSRGKLKYP